MEEWMERKYFGLLVAFSLIGGLLGGLISTQFLSGVPAAFAQRAPSHQQVLAAEEFHLLDSSGKTRVVAKQDANDSLAISLYDRDGKHRFTFGLSPEGLPTMKFGSKPK
jgi:hypothetical protein